VGGRVWLWVIPFVLLYGLWSFFGFDITGPSNRDFGEFLDTASGQEFFGGNWGWYAVVVVQLIFNSVLGEDLLFRGLLLPRMRASSGGAISSPAGCCSGSTICTSRGRSPPPWWPTSSLPAIPRGGGRARGWGLSSTQTRASSSSLSSSPSCLAELCTPVTPALSGTSYPDGLFIQVPGARL
jgi:hypothetical protein